MPNTPVYWSLSLKKKRDEKKQKRKTPQQKYFEQDAEFSRIPRLSRTTGTLFLAAWPLNLTPGEDSRTETCGTWLPKKMHPKTSATVSGTENDTERVSEYIGYRISTEFRFRVISHLTPCAVDDENLPRAALHQGLPRPTRQSPQKRRKHNPMSGQQSRRQHQQQRQPQQRHRRRQKKKLCTEKATETGAATPTSSSPTSWVSNSGSSSSSSNSRQHLHPQQHKYQHPTLTNIINHNHHHQTSQPPTQTSQPPPPPPPPPPSPATNKKTDGGDLACLDEISEVGVLSLPADGFDGPRQTDESDAFASHVPVQSRRSSRKSRRGPRKKKQKQKTRHGVRSVYRW